MLLPTFNPLVQRLSPPPIPAVQAWARAYEGVKGPLIDLSQAVPGYPPHPDMLAFLGEAAADRGNTGYGAIEGERALRAAYAEHVSELFSADVLPANIHITAGANQAFMCAAMAVAGHGDRVALTNPLYFNQETTLAMLGIVPVLVDCDPEAGFLPELGAVKAALAEGIKALVLVSPNNPTGAVYPALLLGEILTLCRKAGTWLILDETYRDFIADETGRPHDLLSVPGWQDALILLYSFSKSYCIPGHRLGAVTAGPRVVDEIAKVMDNLQICAPRAPQAAVARAIPALAGWRRDNRAEIMRRAEALRQTMAGLDGWRIEALGAYFAFVRHPFPDRGSAFVAEHLTLRAGILSLPGVYFGPGQDPYLRFAFANADSAVIGGLGGRLAGFTLP